MFTSLRAAMTSFLDPKRADRVAILTESTSCHLPLLRKRLLLEPEGRRLLRDRPLVTHRWIPELELMPPHSFGKKYLDFLKSNGLDPNARTPVTLIRDAELAYVMTRYRQAHDFWHVLTGLSHINVEQELALKVFEYVQFGMPAALLSSIVGPFKLSMEERDRLFTIYYPWAMRSARNAKCLLSVYYEEKFNMPLAELQSELRLEPFPE